MVARRHILRIIITAVIALAAGRGVDAAPLEVRQIFAKEPLTGRLPASVTWAPDGSRFLATFPGGERESLVTRVYDVHRGQWRDFFRANADGLGARPAPEFVWSPDSTQLAYLDGGALWSIDARGTHRKRLAREADDPQWSPDGSSIAFAQGSELALVAVRSGAVRLLSRDGSDLVANASPDWVYSEELGMRHAFRWSPDGASIAYLRTDDSPVSAFPILNSAPFHNRVRDQRYPNAGEANPIATARVVRVRDGFTRTLATTRGADDYLSWIGFTGANVPAVERIDRVQQQRRIIAYETQPRTLYTQHDPAWIDRIDDPLIVDHDHLAIATRDGATNDIRVIDTNAGTSRRVFTAIAIASLDAVDHTTRTLYVQANAPTRRDATAFAIPLVGGRARAFDREHGTHHYVFSADGRAYTVTTSTFGVPPTVAVGTSPSARRIVARSKSVDALGFGATKLIEVPTSLGTLDATMIVPPDFDPTKRYPVVTYVYGGPSAPTTSDGWGGTTYLFHQLLAQHGFIVFSIDGPGSQIDGSGARRLLRNNLGDGALAGQREGARYLASLPYVDPARIGLWGWSYGGYMTTFALTHAPDVWKAGFAVAPVTDWHRYDSIYTERYMGLPQAHAASYARASSSAAAAHMHAWLMLAHGTGDDNVHVANTLAFTTALTDAGRSFDLALYPGKRHDIAGTAQRRDLFSRMVRFWTTHL